MIFELIHFSLDFFPQLLLTFTQLFVIFDLLYPTLLAVGGCLTCGFLIIKTLINLLLEILKANCSVPFKLLFCPNSSIRVNGIGFESISVSVKIDLLDFLSIFVTAFSMLSTTFTDKVVGCHAIEVCVFVFFLHEALNLSKKFLFFFLELFSIFFQFLLLLL